MFDFTQTEAVPKQDYHDGMARLAAGVCIIATRVDGHPEGMTATSVCSVSDVPPTLLVCLNQLSSTFQACLKSEILSVNVLSPHATQLCETFAKPRSTVEKFSFGQWHTGTTGAPLLTDALVIFDCRIVSTHRVHSHGVLFCEPVSVQVGSAHEGLGYFNRRLIRMAAH
ncbi:flavin reductase [Pseudomonas chlororaphis]|uniref:flavin reductase n=1 Tax=Pseudomonas chlororaphis TaxID=587753 RepID=UPI001B308492|nr:flavin reductase [Pseudomonas chlororaphis]MBP5077263.1 flavin reductase [Pseudomonas chlororaphis]QTT88479.1 flavin reductase [Pseudomonas chlororaphis]WDG77735.1 flavin reductase [Pseudomonas chlororaphis]WDG83028.1 flavin reductase [Pseudomonas chlororaphis]